MSKFLFVACALAGLAGSMPVDGQASAPKSKVKAAQPTLIARPPWTPAHKIGDRVQVYYKSWYPATIREVGKGDYRGFYRVAFDEFSRQRWVDNDEIRVIPKGATHPLAFLTGDYKCYRRVRPKQPVLVDELYLNASGDYSMRDDVRPGRVMLGEDGKIIWHGGALDEADAHVDGRGMLHIVRTRHEHFTDSDPKQMECILG